MSKLLRILFNSKNLLKTNAILGTTLMAAGDVLAQDLEMNHFFELPIFKKIGLSSPLTAKQTYETRTLDDNDHAGKIARELISTAIKTWTPKENLNVEENLTLKSLISGMFNSENLKNVNLKQSGSMALGGFYFGVAGHYWYQYLERRFMNRRKALLKKLLADGLAGPPFAIGLFTITGAAKGQSISDSMRDFRNNIWLILAADWLFFVPLQTINFRYLPVKYRVLYVGFLTLIYDTFLSHLMNGNTAVGGHL